MLHHVIPKHEWKQRFVTLAGIDAPDNLVNLTAEQHTQAHQLLYEINKNEYDRIAFLTLSGQIGKEEAQRRAASVANTGKQYALGCKRSEQTKRMISEANRGKRLGPGYVRTDKQKQHTSSVMLGNRNAVGSKRTNKFKEHLSDHKMGRPYKTIICPGCKKSGGSNVMRRWHFENCRAERKEK